MDVNDTYPKDHFTIYTNIESLCYIPEPKILLYANYTSIKKKKRHHPILSLFIQPAA